MRQRRYTFSHRCQFLMYRLKGRLVENIGAPEILSCLTQTGSHGFFSSTKGNTRIVHLLVRLISSLGVSDLSLEVIVIFSFESSNSVPECPLSIGINVHLDNSGLDGVLDIFDRRSRSSVEDKSHRLFFSVVEFLSEVFLCVVENDRLEVDISWSINTMDVSEGGGTGEGSVLDLRKLFVGVPNLFRLGVKAVGVDISVIDTVFFTSRDTEFELEHDIELGELLHVLLADTDVFFKGFLGKVKHVRGEERVSLFGVEFLVGLDQTVHPRQPSLLAVISVKNDRNSIKSSNFVNVLGGSDTPGDGSLVVGVVCGLSGNEETTSLRESDNDGSPVNLGSLHTGVDGRGSYNIYSGNGEPFLLCVIEKVDEGLSGDNTRLDGSRQFSEGLSLFSGFSRHG